MSEEQKYEQRRQEALKRKKALHKMQTAKVKPATKQKLITAAVSLLVVVLLVTWGFFNLGFPRRMVSAMTVGGEKVSSAEFNYYYTQQAVNTYNTYYEYFGGSYVPFDTGKSLDKQMYSEEQSWADYIEESAKTAVVDVKSLALAAKEADFTLSEDGQTYVENQMLTYELYAEASKISVDRYLAISYGLGVNEDLMRDMLSEYQLAMEYDAYIYDSFSYTDEEKEAYYQNEVKNDYTYVDVRLMAFVTAEADEDTEEVTLEQAKEQADAFAEVATTEAKFSEKALEILKERAKAAAEAGKEEEAVNAVTDNTEFLETSLKNIETVDSNLLTWVTDEARTEGDVAVVEMDDEAGYYVVYMIKTAYRQEYNTKDVRQIYVAAEDTTEEAMAEAKKQAEELLEQWKNGAANEATFEELAKKESDLADDGGLAEEVVKSDDAIGEWLFDEARVEGDTAVLEGDGGYHVIYYKGDNAPLWLIQVDSAMRSADYNKMFDEIAAKYTVTESGFGLWLKEDPFR